MSGICGVIHPGRTQASLHKEISLLQADLEDFGERDNAWSGNGAELRLRQEKIYRRDHLETQPVVCRNLVLLSDARLLHSSSLAERLGIPINERATTADSSLILTAWQRWGESAVDYLEGDFCFVLWDTAAKTLTLVRDHLGGRPLYYALWPGGIAFSTSLSGLPRLPLADTRLDDQAIAEYMMSWQTERTATPYLGIRRLHPGSISHWNARTGFTTRTYWDIRAAPRIRLARAEDYTEAVRERLSSIIAHCCDTNYPVGLALSGGLDSSTLAGLTARQLASQGRELLTASSVLPTDHQGAAWDEREFMEAVCDHHPNIRPQWITAEDRLLFNNTAESVRKYGQPRWNPFAVMDNALQTALKESGARVVLSGRQGDAVWSFEHPLFPIDFALRGQPIRGWKELKALSQKYQVGRRTIAKLALAPYRVLTPLRGADYRTRLEAYAVPSAINIELARQTKVAERIRRMRIRDLPTLTLRDAQLTDLANPTWPRLHEEGAREAAAMNLSRRSPLWDRKLLELCVSAPPWLLHQGGMGRSLVREVGQDIVPEKVRSRISKGAFLPDFHARVLREASKVVENLDLFSSEHLAPKYIDFSRVRDSLDNLRGEIAAERWTLEAQCVIYRAVEVGMFFHLYEGGALA